MYITVYLYIQPLNSNPLPRGKKVKMSNVCTYRPITQETEAGD